MSYQKLWASCTHKTNRMMTMCTSRTTLGKILAEVTVEPVLFLYMLSTFSQYALFQDLVYSKVCWGQYSKDSNICQHLHTPEYKEELETVQRLSSHWILMSTISLVCPSILIAMYLGAWSDRFGRKWPVVFPPLGGVCACLVYIVISVKDEVPVAWICLASFLSGLSGGFVSCIMSCMTYVATVTTEENRTMRISRLEAMTFIGGTVGPFVSGSMLPWTGHAYAFFYMMVCYTVAFLYALVFVKDINQTQLRIGAEGHSETDDKSGRSSRNSGRSRNKSSDTIPSSIATTSISTSSGAEDLEQKEGLLSGSDLHVGETVGSSDISTIATSSGLGKPQNDLADTRQAISSLVDYMIADTESASLSQGISHQNEDVSGIQQIVNNTSAVVSNNLHNNRNSLGSSGRNSSLHGHDDGSSATSDDDQRNILRGHSSTLDVDDSSCCYKYFKHCFSAVYTVAKKRKNGKRALLISSLLASFMFMVVTAGEMDVAYLFARAEPLSWSYQTYSYFFGFKYGFGAFILLVAMPLFQKLKVEDSTLVILGMMSRIASLVLYGLSVNSYMAFSVPLVAVFSVFTIPATRSLLSKMVHQDEQGKMFAFVAMMEDICTLVASLIFNSIYPLTRPILQGLIFLLAAVILLVPIVIMWYVRGKLIQITKHQQVSTMCRAHLNSVEAADPAALLCIPKDFEVGK